LLPGDLFVFEVTRGSSLLGCSREILQLAIDVPEELSPRRLPCLFAGLSVLCVGETEREEGEDRPYGEKGR
jgi:hypothetical protein